MPRPTEHPVLDLIRRRVSVERFDPGHTLSEREIRDLVEVAVEAPSSFHIQHWRFVAVRRREDKERLRQAAFGQRQVAEAAATFIVLGDCRGVEKISSAMELVVKSGAISRGKAEAWINMAPRIYADERLARDEALRSGCLAAMLLMLAAEARELASCPIGGFDVGRVKREFAIAERYVPVMLVAVGRPASTKGIHKPRLPVDELLAFDRGRIF